MNTIRSFLFIAFLLPCAQFCLAQSYHIGLPQISGIDDEGLHLLVFSRSPINPLVIPHIDTTGVGFFQVFYSWKVKGYPDIDAMVVPSLNGDQLFIDLNNNRDLTDDGPPAMFPYSQNDFSFAVSSPADQSQRTRFLLQRMPNVPDSSRASFVDSTGDLNPRFARFWGGMAGNVPFEGKRGTFYFDRRLSVRRNTVSIGSTTHEIGLFDYDNDGLFNGKEDVLLIDLDHDGRLCYFRYAFRLGDVITLDSLRLTVAQTDPYGRWVELAATTKAPAPSVLKPESLLQEDGIKGPIDKSVWDVSARSLSGDTVTLKQFKGKYLLLNFWGEWCKPCLDEIPRLVEASARHRSKNLNIVSFLKSYNLDMAKAVIRGQSMNWPHLLLTDSLETMFKVRGYPTNLLILPNGQYYLEVGSMQQSFLDSHVR